MPQALSTVLVVEDDDDIRESISDWLALQGYVVESARNGAEALERLQARRADVVLLDLMMPIMDGRAFLRALRADAALAGVPVVVVSAAGATGLDEGIPFVGKPFEARALVEALENAAQERTPPGSPAG